MVSLLRAACFTVVKDSSGDLRYLNYNATLEIPWKNQRADTEFRPFDSGIGCRTDQTCCCRMLPSPDGDVNRHHFVN